MSEKHDINDYEEWEMRVRETSRQFEFPTTPKISEQVQRNLHPRPLVLRPVAALILALLLVILFAVPEIRAAITEFLRIGAGTVVIIPEPTAYPTLNLSLLESGTEVSLEEADAEFRHPIALPGVLGNPDRLFLQEAQLPMLVLLWYEPQAYETSRILLYLIDSRDAFFKFTPDVPEIVWVNGQRAVWFTDPHLMEYIENSSRLVTRPVDGNVLLWSTGQLTYRLEGDLTLEQALEIAESIP